MSLNDKCGVKPPHKKRRQVAALQGVETPSAPAPAPAPASAPASAPAPAPAPALSPKALTQQVRHLDKEHATVSPKPRHNFAREGMQILIGHVVVVTHIK